MMEDDLMLETSQDGDNETVCVKKIQEPTERMEIDNQMIARKNKEVHKGKAFQSEREDISHRNRHNSYLHTMYPTE